VTEPGVVPTSPGWRTGDRTTDLKRSAVISGTGIHRLYIGIYVWQRLLTTPVFPGWGLVEGQGGGGAAQDIAEEPDRQDPASYAQLTLGDYILYIHRSYIYIYIYICVCV